MKEDTPRPAEQAKPPLTSEQIRERDAESERFTEGRIRQTAIDLQEQNPHD